MSPLQAVKIAKAMGAEVTVISTSDRKREEALGHLGAQHFLISKDEAAMKVRSAGLPPFSGGHALLRGHGYRQTAGIETLWRETQSY